MNINNDRLRSQLILEEDLRLVAYDDATGKPVPPDGTCRGKLTIGVGRNLEANPFTEAEMAIIGHDGRSLPITHDQAIMLLDDDIKTVCGQLDYRLPWWAHLDEIRGRVLIDLCFNMGIVALIGFQHFLTALRAGDYDTAADELKNSLWYNQVGSRGLRLVAMVRTGEDWTV